MILQHVLKWKICHLCTSAEFRKREVSWQHRLKTFFPNGLVYKKLARRNIFCFINSISMLVVLTYCYHYSYSCSSSYYYYYYYFYYYYHYCYYFIVIILVLSMLFILFYFISFYFLLFILLWFLSAILCDVTCVCVPSLLFFFSFFR